LILKFYLPNIIISKLCNTCQRVQKLTKLRRKKKEENMQQIKTDLIDELVILNKDLIFFGDL